jgi:opacity protein-like surface antigen
MKKIISALFLGALSTSVIAAENDWSGHASLLFGSKNLDSKDWAGSTDKQGSGGIMIDFKKNSWPVSIAVDLIGSAEEKLTNGIKQEAEIAEVDLGLRKIWQLSSLPLSPYIGGGVAFVNAIQENNSQGKYTKNEDDTVGAWAGVGTYWNITDRFTLGADLRYTHAEVKLAGKDVDAGSYQVGISAGLNW